MTNVEKSIEAILSQPECIEVYQDNISDYLYDQINDYDVFMLTATFTKDNEERTASMIFNNQFINNMNWASNPAHDLICDLIFCECSACEIDGVGSITDIYSNSGTPIFYIHPATGSARRLREKPVNTAPMTEDLLKLANELKAVPGIIDVEFEQIIDPDLLSTAGPDAVYVRCTTDVPPLYYAGLVVPMFGLEIESNRQLQVTRISQLLTQ